MDQILQGATSVDLRPAERPPWILPSVADAGEALPCVVLADSTGLVEFEVLQRQLGRLGVPCVHLDTRSIVDVRVTAGVGDGSLLVNGRRIVPVVAWLRHFTGRGVPRLDDPAAAAFRADSWCAMVHEVVASASITVPGGAPGRLEQLADASTVGLRTPRTIVTTDLASAAAGLSSERIVVKALGQHVVEPEPGLLVYALPEIVRRGDLDGSGSPGFPVIAQEYVEHEQELRIYYVHGDIHAFEVVKESPDAPWRNEPTVRVAPAAAPAAVADAVSALAEMWSLTYGAFDILIAGGSPCFLEVNPDGDWRWFEVRAGVSNVTDAVAAMVRALYRSALGGVPALPAVELVDFLLMRGER
ncbi:hypothetical protein [Virgisporangium ochraceum]|uniref:hypothetical protein n=1 Tax=Virgisporangium ochraceum TaxID=65505 RepID=UPI00194070F7|nr:hypothetical protein [Virgisporangium ochraceum]